MKRTILLMLVLALLLSACGKTKFDSTVSEPSATAQTASETQAVPETATESVPETEPPAPGPFGAVELALPAAGADLYPVAMTVEAEEGAF